MLSRHAMQMALSDEKCVDVTYEDPAEELQALRERIDCERAVRHDGGALLAAAQTGVRAALAAAQRGSGAVAADPPAASSSLAASEEEAQGALPADLRVGMGHQLGEAEAAPPASAGYL